MCALAAPSDEEWVGYLIFEIETRDPGVLSAGYKHAMLHHICVSDGHRQKGIGRALLRHLDQRLARQGISRIAAMFGTFNTASANLLAKHGLTPTTVLAERYMGAPPTSGDLDQTTHNYKSNEA